MRCRAQQPVGGSLEHYSTLVLRFWQNNHITFLSQGPQGKAGLDQDAPRGTPCSTHDQGEDREVSMTMSQEHFHWTLEVKEGVHWTETKGVSEEVAPAEASTAAPQMFTVSISEIWTTLGTQTC